MVDNGPEFQSRALDAWAHHRRVQLQFIRPGKPVENAFIESFNGKLREECLIQYWFLSLADARRTDRGLAPQLQHRAPTPGARYPHPQPVCTTTSGTENHPAVSLKADLKRGYGQATVRPSPRRHRPSLRHNGRRTMILMG